MQKWSHDLPPSLYWCDSDGTNSRLRCLWLTAAFIPAFPRVLRPPTIYSFKNATWAGRDGTRFAASKVLWTHSHCSLLLCWRTTFFPFAPAYPNFFFFSHHSSLPTSPFRPRLSSEFMQGGHTFPCCSQDPSGEKSLGSLVREGVCLDIKHQAATSAGLIKTSQLPVICLATERDWGEK